MLGLILMIIVICALALIALAFIDKPIWEKRAKENAEPSHIEKVREAAFAVIEASLEAEPENWEPVPFSQTNPEITWLINRQSKTALHLHSDGTALVSINNDFFDGTPIRGEKLKPPFHIQRSLYRSAMRVISPALENKEKQRLSQMVSAFGDIIKGDMVNDQATARTTSIH